MHLLDLPHLIGSIQWLAATVCLAAAAWNAAPVWLPATGSDLDRRVERGLRTVLLTALAMALSVALLGAFGALNGPALLVFALVAWVFSTRLKEQGEIRAEGSERLERRWIGTAVAASSAVVVVVIDAAVYLLVPPTNWDAMTYHLYLPARWIQEGFIFHVPTVFADAHAAYAPQNGALIFAWQMALSGFDTLCNLVQPALLIFGVVVLSRLAKELLPGKGCGLAAPAAAGLFWFLAPVRKWALTANVDVLMTVFWLAAVYWAVRSWRRKEASAAVASCLALGLVAGTKWAGVLLAVVPGLFVVAAIVRYRWWLQIPAAGALSVLGGGWWYLRNLRLYGNPMFPLDFEVLGLHFEGAFRSSAMADSFLRLDPAVWWTTLPRSFGWATCAVAAVGVVGLLAVLLHPVARPRARLASAGVLLFVAAWTFYCAAILPYNSQFRFLIPALAACCLGWVPVLRGLGQVASRAAVAVWSLALICLVVLPPSPDLWRRPLLVFQQAGVVWMALVSLALTAGLVACGWILRRSSSAQRPRRRFGLLVAPVLGLLMAGVGGTVADQVRPGFLATADFRFQAMGILPLQDPQQAPMTVAYSGMNVPYALMGPGFRHRVIYVNTGGEATDGFFEFWRRAREQREGLYSTHKPGLYRGPSDQAGPWMERLRAEDVDAVALFKILGPERPAHWPLDEDFPIERRWIRDVMRGRSPGPTSGPGFRPLLISELAEIYLVQRIPPASS